ncbi:MAG: Cys-tRNA(Pro) deacylase [Thermomicrobiales bacterium]
MKTTRATQMLSKQRIPFVVYEHRYDPDADRKGLQAAEALGESPDRVFKTLIATVDGKPVCVAIPANREASMKKLAAAFGGKAAQMVAPADAERMTGYVVGGISPFGQKRTLSKAIDRSALAQERIFLNGGGRGVQISITPDDAVAALGAIVVDLLADGHHPG